MTELHMKRWGIWGIEALSPTHRIPPFALTNQHQVNAERARPKQPFSSFGRVQLIFDQKFLSIKTMTYFLFGNLTDTELTPSTSAPSLSTEKSIPPALPTPPPSVGGSHLNFSLKKEQILTPQIESLEAEIESAKNALAEQTRLAVNEATTQATLLKRGKEIAERKEVLKLLQLQLRQAKKDHAAQKAEEDQAERLGRRRQIAEISEGVTDDVKKLAAAIRRAAPHYKSINDRVWQIMQLGENAADFDLGLFKSANPTTKAYEIFVHLAAREFGLGPADHFSHWPRSHQIEESIQKALATFVDVGNWPREDEPAEDREFEEITAEELENAI